MAKWTEDEVDLLHACMLRGYGPTQTSSEFTAKGYSRTVKAISTKKAKEISIGEKNWKMPIAIDNGTVKLKDKQVAEALNKEANYVLMVAMLIGAMIIGWWFVS